MSCNAGADPGFGRIGAAVHLEMEITVNAAGQIEGTVVTPAPEASTTFSGVLELLKVLEDAVDGDQPAPFGTGAPA